MPFQSKRRVPEQRPSRYGGTYTAHVMMVKCCGVEFECSANTNTCQHCGADYNGFGQGLAPRHLWGEETGEHPSECI
jgi:hypothetical protein